MTEKAMRVRKKKFNLLAFVGLHRIYGAVRVVVALVQTISSELLVASGAMKLDDAGKKLPEKVSPRSFACT